MLEWLHSTDVDVGQVLSHIQKEHQSVAVFLAQARLSFVAWRRASAAVQHKSKH